MEYDTATQVILNFNRNPPWWERRSNLERRVIIVSGILFVVAVILLLALAIVLLQNAEGNYHYNSMYSYDYDAESFDNYKEVPSSICLAPGCIHTASTMLKYMDPHVTPCHDFYHFACGGFINETSVPGGEVSVDSFSSAFDMLLEQLRTVIEDPPIHKNVKPFSLLTRLYDICMDTSSAEVHSLQNIKMTLHELGGWPVLEEYEWQEQTFDWLISLRNFRQMGFDVNHFMTLEILTDYSNYSRPIFVLDEAVIGTEKYLLINGLTDEHVKAYRLYMIDVAVLFGANLEFAINELEKALEFEIKLAQISFLRDVWNGTTIVHTMTVGELQRRYPSIDWFQYMNFVIGMPEFQVTFEDTVIVRSPQYISELEKVLAWTSKRVQANYIMWRAVKSSVQFLTEQLRNRRFDFYSVTYGLTDRASRWKECVNLVTKGVPFAVGSLYVHKYIEENAKEVVMEMVSLVRNQFIELIRRVDWMDDITKMNAVDKASAIGVRTAYYDEFLSLSNLQQYYAQLEFPDANFLSCILRLNLFERNKYFGRLLQTTQKSDRRDEDMYTTTVQPTYERTRNILNIPSGILQGMFFSADRPQFLNYGALGYLIGQEIAYGFDSTGGHFDKEGNVHDWWTEYTKKAFVQKAHCLNIDHRKFTTLPELDIYSEDMDSMENNVADNAGLKAAYWAYVEWVNRFGREYHIPSLNQYTPRQLFWIAAVQTQCAKYRLEYLKEEGYSKEHSPAFYKVQAAISNSEEFSRDFRCPPGSPMNPVHKCYVW